MCASDLGAPLGAQETTFAMRDHLGPGESSFIDFFSPIGDKACATFATGEVTLEALYGKAVAKRLVLAPSLDEIPAE